MLRTKKSVEFLLQPSSSDPAKRGGCKPPEQQAPVRWTAKQVVEGMYTQMYNNNNNNNNNRRQVE
jgi:hypothetical protein